ncbi:MAG TPA: phosphoglucosamine mutase [Ignavibacteriales bacterium]|nr:phosphoglucosamine mutase [Ignavibacteriales bacterium]HOL80743.1 phosphoglucosamine mutase [Ignavibacteriales bacterium]HPP33179.1 phosphoglucosamine mutase [Ignavibacteriales bacterium]
MSVLMVSVSGIRGIIGNGLEPETIVKHTSAFAEFIKGKKIVIGRDGRISGEMVRNIIVGTLQAKGIDIVDLGICPTPTVLLMVRELKADGGIVITASHNPNEWNALKLVNNKGLFLSPEENTLLRDIEKKSNFNYTTWDKLGKITFQDGIKTHIEKILSIKHLNIEKLKEKKFKVLVDCVNGAGSYCVTDLLKALGCEVIEINCEKNGIFPRLPEPIPQNLIETMSEVKNNNVDIGIVVDPDVDRLVLLTETGEPFVEENTITQITKFILSKEKGNVVVNLSTTRAVKDVVEQTGCNLYLAPVGEANVVKKMLEVNAIIGGEGSGGVIYPAANFCRDALVGIALTLQHLLEFGGKASELKKSLPEYFIVKRKFEIHGKNGDEILNNLKNEFKNYQLNDEDGLRIDTEEYWINFRKSNTEPIIRITCEAKSEQKANEIIDNYLKIVEKYL